MTPVRCISRGTGEFGDCYRACLASILDLSAEEVPNFGHLASTSHGEARDLAAAWLAERGLGTFWTVANGKWSLDEVLREFSEWNPGVPCVLHGEAALKGEGDINHAVVMLDGAIIHDPSGAGVCGPCVNIEGERIWWWIEVVSVGREWQRRLEA